MVVFDSVIVIRRSAYEPGRQAIEPRVPIVFAQWPTCGAVMVVCNQVKHATFSPTLIPLATYLCGEPETYWLPTDGLASRLAVPMVQVK